MDPIADVEAVLAAGATIKKTKKKSNFKLLDNELLNPDYELSIKQESLLDGKTSSHHIADQKQQAQILSFSKCEVFSEFQPLLEIAYKIEKSMSSALTSFNECSSKISALTTKIDELEKVVCGIHLQLRQFDRQDIGKHQIRTTVL